MIVRTTNGSWPQTHFTFVESFSLHSSSLLLLHVVDSLLLLDAAHEFQHKKNGPNEIINSIRFDSVDHLLDDTQIIHWKSRNYFWLFFVVNFYGIFMKSRENRAQFWAFRNALMCSWITGSNLRFCTFYHLSKEERKIHSLTPMSSSETRWFGSDG